MKTILSATLGLMKTLSALVILALAALALAVTPTIRQASTVVPTQWDEPASSAWQTVTLSESNRRNITLDRTKDYLIQCPGSKVTVQGTVSIWGGHNVVLEDCTVDNEDPGTVNSSGQLAYSGAIQFKNQTGTVWVHDVHLAGPHLNEGIDLQEPDPGVAVVLRDVLIDEVRMDQTGGHNDVLQTWCGPAILRMDGVSAATDYQGLFLLPNQNGGCASTAPEVYDFRHVDIAGVTDTRAPATLGWAGWFGADAKANVDWRLDHVYMSGENPIQFWPNRNQWADVTAGVPPGGPYVRATSYGATGPFEPCSGAGCSGSAGAWGAGEDPAP